MNLFFENLILFHFFCSKTSTDADDIGDFVDNDNGPVVDPVSKALMNLLSNLLEDLTVHLKDDKKMIILLCKDGTSGQNWAKFLV